jgi:hypothetical protein
LTSRPAARVIALDRDPVSLSALRSRGLKNIEVLPPIHFPDLPEFSPRPTVAYMRWLLCYLGAADTEALFRTLFDRLLPGGRLLIHDYINYRSARLEPPSKVVHDVIDAFYGEIKEIGFSLPAILVRCGFQISWKRVVPMAITPADEAWSWPDQFFRLYVPQHIPPELAKLFMEEWEVASKDPTTVFYSWPVIQIVAEKPPVESSWQSEPEKSTRTDFVFLSVDVIGHSKLYVERPSNTRLAAIHRALSKLRTFTTECLGPEYKDYMLWDWASDGGIFGFPSSRIDLNTTEMVLKKAIHIWKTLPNFNADWIANDLKDGFALHIALDRGDAYYDTDPTMRRSDALNNAAKLKSPTGQTEILITERIKNDLPDYYGDDFVVISRDAGRQPIYGYLPALERGMEELGERHCESKQYVEAAQCFYRLGRFCLAARKPDQAIPPFERAVATLDRLPVRDRHRYFFYALRAYYEAWLSLVRERGADVKDSYRHTETFLPDSSSAFATLFESVEWTRRGEILTHMDCIFNQGDILCDKMVNTPAGLSTLEVALLLERMGYPPSLFGDALTKRLDRLEGETAQNHGRSIDGDCSMCTGMAVSALVLGHRRDRAGDLIDWLTLLKPVHFCWLRRGPDAEPHQHAMHYAAAVLQGFLDNHANPSTIVEEFFRSTDCNEQGFLVDWMRYRDNDAFEVCTYILPVFTRYVLAGYTLTEDQQTTLRTAIDALAKNLFRETDSAGISTTPGSLDASKENLGSLSLGLLLGRMSQPTQQIMKDVLRLFDARSKSPYIATSGRMLDSSLDRTRRYLEGWLLYWEVSLRLEAGDSGI